MRPSLWHVIEKHWWLIRMLLTPTSIAVCCWSRSACKSSLIFFLSFLLWRQCLDFSVSKTQVCRFKAGHFDHSITFDYIRLCSASSVVHVPCRFLALVKTRSQATQHWPLPPSPSIHQCLWSPLAICIASLETGISVVISIQKREQVRGINYKAWMEYLFSFYDQKRKKKNQYAQSVPPCIDNDSAYPFGVAVHNESLDPAHFT